MAHPREHAESWAPWAPTPPQWSPEEWARLEAWLYGVDLYNHGYWWESHEQLERLWRSAERGTDARRFVQAIIKLAAAALNDHLGKRDAACAQAAAAGTVLDEISKRHRGVYMGADLQPLCEAIHGWLQGIVASQPIIRLGPA